MKFCKIIGATCFFLFLMPLLLAATQEPASPEKQLRDLTNQWRKDANNGKDLEARKRAMDGFAAMSSEVSSLVTSLQVGLTDLDDGIRLKAATGLAAIGP